MNHTKPNYRHASQGRKGTTFLWFLISALILCGLGLFSTAQSRGVRPASHVQTDKTKPGRPVTPPSVCCIPTSDEIYLFPGRIYQPQSATALIELKDYKIAVSVKDQVATTSIDQVFVNKSDRTLEAKYLYPLPEDANFSSFTVTLNGKAIEGTIMEKDKARQTYQAIVQKLIDPGLMEFIDNRTVQVSVAPILAGEEKKIHLSYTQVLKQDGGLYKYQYPFGTRNENSKLPDNTALSLNIQSDQPLKTLYSPSHTPKIDRKGDKDAAVTLNLSDPSAQSQKAFVFYFSQDNQTISLNSLVYKKSEKDDGYFLMTLRSPLRAVSKESLPKNMVLAIDTSGSMSGEKIQQARQSLKYIVEHLQPKDQFNIVQFNTDVSRFKSDLVPANAENIKDALRYVEGLNADGSTNIEDAIKTAFKQVHSSSERPGYVIFLTDGEPTVGITDTEGLVKASTQANTSEAKIFNFGVGYDVRTTLLNKLATENHGSTTYVEPNENLELALSSFYNKIVAPVLTDVKVSFDNVEVDRIYPSEVGDLFLGSEVVVLGRFKHGGDGKVVLTGKSGKVLETFSYPLHWKNGEITDHQYLPRLWAGRRIGALLENITQNGENAENKAEIIHLSKQYGIITPYTSFLAMEPGMVSPKEKDEDKNQFDAPSMSSSLGGAYGGGGAHRRGASSPGSASGYAPKPAAPLSQMADLKSTSGMGNVRANKAMKKIQSQANAQELDEAQSADGRIGPALMLKNVGEKSFMLTAGIWTDTAYDKTKNGEPRRITFGSDEYFKLLKDKPELIPYFSLGKEVLVLLDNVAYQVVAPKAS